MDPQERIAELEAENARLRAVIADLHAVAAEMTELRAANERLQARVGRLEAERNRHSGNSSKPPSSDTVSQRAAQKARRASWGKQKKGRHPGKQPGSEGRHLAQVADPDRVVVHAPKSCPACGASMQAAPVVSVERASLRHPRPHSCGGRAPGRGRRCSCGIASSGTFPPEAAAPACWGPRVRAIATYLMVRQHLPVARTAELLEDVLGAPVSTGWLAALPAQAAGDLDGFIADLKARLCAAPLLHVDETGGRTAGVREWIHVASTSLLTLLDCHRRRGVEATDAIGVLPGFRGVAMHDRWAPYWANGCTHAVCGAHLLRDLAGMAEIPSQTSWAEAMARLLLDAKDHAEQARTAGASAVEEATRERIRQRFDEIVAEGMAANPTPIRWSGRTALEGRAGSPHGEAAAEGERLLPHPRRSSALLRGPKLHLNSAKAWGPRSRRPRPTLRRQAVDDPVRPTHLNSYGQHIPLDRRTD
ncbi:MAG: IS66 family transposase [Actinomycetota bacterium]